MHNQGKRHGHSTDRWPRWLLVAASFGVLLGTIGALQCPPEDPDSANNGPAAATDAEPLPSGVRIRLDRENIQVVDGDTARVRGSSVRFLGADAPEQVTSFFEGSQEPYASRASDYCRRAFDDADVIELELVASDDTYGRRLGHFFVDGESLSLALVREGLAWETVSHFGDNGFPDLAAAILEAHENAERDFQEPYHWRQAHRAQD